MNFHKITKLWYIFLIVPLVFMHSCKKEDPVPAVVASFQFKADADNFLLVAFTNFSQNAVSFSWDFGDTNTSTDKDPTHEYAATGTYTVKLTATAADGSTSEKTEEVEVVDPDEALTLLAGNTSKIWKLVREGASIGIGPDADNWSFWWNLTNDGTRNCVYDDEFIFSRGGGFEFKDNGTFWGEGDVYPVGSDKENLNETCFDATSGNLTVDGVDNSAWLSSSTHTYTYNSTDKKITLSGMGAWMGLVKLGTDGYVTTPQASTTFDVVLTDGGTSGVDTLDVIFDYSSIGNYWKIRYVSYDDASKEPVISGPQPKASFSVSVDVSTKVATFTNNSTDSDSYSWDFGDGAGTSTDENPSYTYAAVGVYPVKLEATNENGTVSVTKDVFVGVSDPVATDLHGGSTKTWKLKPVAGALKVGPSIGNGDWWTSSESDVTARDCMFNDEFIFKSDGSYEYASQGDIYGEDYMGFTTTECTSETNLAGVYAGLASSSSYTFSLTEATGSDPASLTVNGDGAFLGFAKGYNGGELNGSDSALPQSITYVVNIFFDEGSTQTIEVGVDIAGDGTAWWTMTLVAQ